MKNFFTKEIFGHPIILVSIGAVVVIALGSGLYYILSTRPPSLDWATPTQGPISEVVTGNGTVTPAQNPDLAFESGGRVAAVNVSVGQVVSQGQLLASLDTSSLEAALSAAEANVANAQANLDELQAGPRDTDVETQQTAVTQAQQSLANLYNNVPAVLTNAYNTVYNGVHSDTDNLFTQPTNPALLFQTTDNQDGINAISDRATLSSQLAAWITQINDLSSSSTPTTLDASLTVVLGGLSSASTYGDHLLAALNGAVPSGSFPQSSITAAQVAVGNFTASVSALVLSLQEEQQQIAAGELAVQSAQDQLNKILAGSTPQAIEAGEAQVEAAQADVQSAQAALANATIVAPFSGTVSSVSVKTGQIVPQNTIAISLIPLSALQIEVYLSEVDAAKITAGDQASVTLDAYGNGQTFSATVVSVDRSPTTDTTDSSSSGPAYKTTLQFTSNNPAIAAGMTANVTITTAQKQNALTIPLSAVIQNGTQTFVLTPSPNGPIQTEITTGIESTNTVEVTSGLSPNEQFLIN